MCNDYAREIEIGRVLKLLKVMDGSEPVWFGGKVPNDIEPRAHIRIKDRGFVVHQQGGQVVAEMMTWSWAGPGGKPVFNFVSEGRDFSKTDRCLIAATGFYEYTTPSAPKVKLKDQHLFTLKGQEWFWIAGLIKQGAFAMLTVEPGPDVQPFHGRQIVVVPPRMGAVWLEPITANSLLAPLPPGALQVHTVRKNGIELPASGQLPSYT